MAQEERPITQRVDERPQIDAGKLKKIAKRELGYRFLAGALTSVVAGVLTITLGSRVGGIMLAFPAILAASLTLIAEEEDSAEAREDARGSVMGGCALALFAAAGALLFGHLNSVAVLAIAAAAWTLGALGGYLLAWFR